MEDDGSELEMLDMLAFNCSELTDTLKKIGNDKKLRKQTIQKYLEKQTKSPHFSAIDDFKQDLDWFNVTEPLSLADNIKGKVVVLDFFTYCCINCMHILPDLHRIENIFSPEQGLAVVGVHCAKFSNEKDSANILSAVQRYGITHAIVNDPNMSMWRKLGIKCWPTLLIVGPTGKPLFVLMGEGHGQLLEDYIRGAIEFFEKENLINHSSLPLSPSTDLMPASNIKFPGKVAYYKDDTMSEGLLAISDSGNHRILIAKPSGEVVDKIGGTFSGFFDGNFESARFNSQQGVAFQNKNILYVADTENHAIRRIDRIKKVVETIAGTGRQGNDRIGGSTGTNQGISSPWDIAVYKTKDMDMSFHVNENDVQEKIVLLVAMAGMHQIWGIFVDGIIWWKFKRIPPMSCTAIIGNGSEENRNNSYPQNAAFAQPSGIAIGKECIYIADSESSCVRKASLLDGKVTAVVGGDRNPLNLFSYGDVDGKQYFAKLQHPLGVSYDTKRNQLYVADTYNHKIKVIDPSINAIVTCPILEFGREEPFQFNEPGGLCVDHTGTLLYVADTNNHSIQLIDLKTLRTRPLQLKFKQQLTETKPSTVNRLRYKNIKVRCVGGSLHVHCIIKLDKNLKLAEGAPQKWKLDANEKNLIVPSSSGILDREHSFSIDMTLPNREPGTVEKFQIKVHLNTCVNTYCLPKIFSIEVPLVFERNEKSLVGEVINVFVSENDLKI